MKIPFIIAHRGGDLAPENTIPSFEAADAMAAKMVEFDVQLSSDENLVVIHDETLDRTSNMKGPVKHFTLADLRLVDAGNWFNPAFAYTQIPMLDEVLDFCSSHNILMNLEIKASDDLEQNLKIAQAVSKRLKDDEKLQSQILLSSFDSQCLFEARKHLPTIAMGYLIDIHDWKVEWLRVSQKLEAEVDVLDCLSVHVNHWSDRTGQVILTEHHVEQIKGLTKAPYLLSYTVNDPSRAQQLRDFGVDAVFSDKLEMIELF